MLPLEPDIVLLNFCGNDSLPTEDPFDSVRGMVHRYLTTLLEAEDASLTSTERAVGLHLVEVLESDIEVWDDFFSLSTEESDSIVELLVYRALARMTTLARSSGARMIVVFIPPQYRQDGYLRYIDQVTEVVETAGGEVLNLMAEFPPRAKKRKTLKTRIQRLVPPLDRFLVWRDLPSIHETNLFLDGVHPTRRGNAIVAKRVFQHLRGDTLSKREPSVAD